MVVENTRVYGLEESILRSKYPMSVQVDKLNGEMTQTVKNLAQSNKGEGHDQFLTGIIVQFDLTFTIKAWTEAERYHFFDFVSSQSTMHRITKFDLNKAYVKYVDNRIIEIIKYKVNEYNELLNIENKEEFFKNNEYNVCNVKEYNDLLKEMYLEILYSNPCGMKLTAGMTTNYRQLKTIYSQRKNHRLPEWREFCSWIETLPYFEELISGKRK